MCAMTAGAKLVQVTFFSDASAKKLKARDVSLEELRDLILKTNAAAKADLPWLKLATFGDKRSDKGSLRHNANVLSISGIEADYDGEVMSFDEAAKILEAGRLSALLYTSPSHTQDKPRWRVLCPTSRDLPPETRANLMERLNRIFGGVFAEESFRLSQSYYYGSVEHNSAHRAVVVDGDCIDRRGDLDGGARAEADAFPTLAEQHNQPVDVERRLAAMRYKGESDAGIHATQLSVTAALLTRGYGIDEVVEKVLEATRKAVDARSDWNWEREKRDIRKMCEAWLRKHPQQEAELRIQQRPQEKIEPVNLWGTFDPPALQRGLLPKVIEDYAFTMGETMGADPARLAMAALTVCGAAISDDIKLQMKQYSGEWRECGRLWVTPVGLPSFKKTPIMTSAARPLRKLDHEMLRQFQFQQGQYKNLSPEDRKGVEPPLQKRLCLEDTTIEAAQEVLMGSASGVLLYQDELSGFFGAMDKYSGSRGAAKDRSFWLQSWSGGAYGLNRISRGASIIPNLSISLLGGIQPDVIRKIAAECHDDGFLARMLPIVLRPAEVGKDAPTPPVAETYGKLVERLTELAPPQTADPYEAFAGTFAGTLIFPEVRQWRPEVAGGTGEEAPRSGAAVTAAYRLGR
jgi:Protein of unknown function (DUF3987)